MNLSQYKDKFWAECMTGKLLLTCTDDMLEKELKVTPKLHRIRLGRLISGEDSAMSILKTASKKGTF